MKKTLACFVVVFMFLFIYSVSAEESKPAENKDCVPTAPLNSEKMNYGKTPFNKLGRGAVNTATCWLEIPAEVCRVSEKNGPLVGYTVGTGLGVFTTLMRGLTGIFDVATFVIPPYGKPLMDPEYAADSLSDSASSCADAQARP